MQMQQIVKPEQHKISKDDAKANPQATHGRVIYHLTWY